VESTPANARDRLEAWLEARAGSLAGLTLDVGSARSARPWIPRPRVTLDTQPQLAPDLLADLEDLTGIPDAAFGSVVCTEVLEHVVHPERALGELHRVTSPGGTLLLSVPWIYPFHPCPYDLRRFTLQGLVQAMESAGWTVAEAEGLPIPPEAHALIVEAVKLITGGRCPRPESLGYSNWVVRAAA
jgi:SAM-dependent methyltransferase